MSTKRWWVVNIIQLAVMCLGTWLAAEYYVPDRTSTVLYDRWIHGAESAIFIFTLGGLLGVTSMAINLLTNGFFTENPWRLRSIVMMYGRVVLASITSIGNIGMLGVVMLSAASVMASVVLLIIIGVFFELKTPD